MPFVDTNDGVPLGEKSFATWHETLDHYQTFRTQEPSPDTARRTLMSCLPQMRECMAAAKKNTSK
jgi:hypothetical protein